jgi:hypothetical protein
VIDARAADRPGRRPVRPRRSTVGREWRWSGPPDGNPAALDTTDRDGPSGYLIAGLRRSETRRKPRREPPGLAVRRVGLRRRTEA